MKEQINKTKELRVRVTPYFKQQVEELASVEGLSVSAYITRMLKLQINETNKNER